MRAAPVLSTQAKVTPRVPACQASTYAVENWASYGTSWTIVAAAFRADGFAFART